MFSRKIDKQTLTLAASGWTYDYTFVLYDHQTESLWYPVKGNEGITSVNGTHADKVLPGIEATRTYWIDWKKDHPDTKLLKY